MKPCSNYRKQIAWLVLRALDSSEEREVRAHVEMCPGCRLYLEELSGISDKLSARSINSDIRASETFHQKLVDRVKAEATVSRWAVFRAQLQSAFPKWKIALPVAGAVAAIVITLMLVVRPPAGSSPRESSINSAALPPAKRNLPPTISNYQMLANHSLEKLDEHLTSEANRNLPPAPVYTVSSLSHAALSD
jgi:anti-sigma factor RsiW